MADENKPDAGRKTIPHPDPEEARKGASLPAPIPEDELPNKEKDLRKARAMLEGKDPAVVDILEKVEAKDKLVKVAKDGKTLDVHPTALEDHAALGWRVVADAVKGLDTDEKAALAADSSVAVAKADEPKIGKRHDAK